MWIKYRKARKNLQVEISRIMVVIIIIIIVTMTINNTDSNRNNNKINKHNIDYSNIKKNKNKSYYNIFFSSAVFYLIK